MDTSEFFTSRTFLVILSIIVFALSGECEATTKKNILHIIIDDLRPQLAAYDGAAFPSHDKHAKMVTPNIDRLARKSALFHRTYAQYALCTPSRTSFLTGRRPESTQVTDNKVYFRDIPGCNFTTLPQFFREHGYTTIGMGKVFHPHEKETPYSWDSFIEIDTSAFSDRDTVVKPISDSDKRSAPDPLPDVNSRDHAIEELTKFAKKKSSTGDEKQNFYMAVGFFKPHTPWYFPEDFESTYPKSEIHIPENRYAPPGMPEVAWYDYHSLTDRDASTRGRKDVHTSFNTSLPDDLIKSYRKGYYSCVSYVDGLVGDVLQALHDLGLARDTVVVLHGDHGYHLGEHGQWMKQSQFEVATRTPLIIHVPGKTDKGIKVDELVELVDIFPTLVDLAGFPTSSYPRCKVNEDNADKFCHEGTSVAPLLSEPDKAIKDAIFSCHSKHLKYGTHRHNVIGKTILDKKFRYTLWVKWDRPMTTHWGEVEAEELYDHTVDIAETTNVAAESKYRKRKRELKHRLIRGWEHALTYTGDKRAIH